MKKNLLHSSLELLDYINEVGFLPLLNMGLGWSAEEVVDEDCQYTKLPDGSCRFGNGKALFCRKAVVLMANSLIERRGLSAGSGGRIFVIIEGVFILIHKREA